MKKKALKTKVPVAAPDPEGPAKLAQLKAYEEGLKYFQQQKFPRAKQALEKALEGPSKELQDRAQMHIRICDQRAARSPVPTVKTAEDHYTQGVALMNLGRWDEAQHVNLVFDVHDVRDGGTDCQSLTDDHLEPSQAPRARGGQRMQLYFMFERGHFLG